MCEAGGSRRRGEGCAHAASPTRLIRSPPGCAQDEGVPLRRSAPLPPPPPARLHVRRGKAGLGPEPLHQVEAERLQLDGEIHALEAHVLGGAEPARREVQDGLDPRGDQRLRHGLGGFRGHGHDGELEVARLRLLRQVSQGEDGHAIGGGPELGGIVVEDGGDPEALTCEAFVVIEGRAEVAEPYEGDLPLPVEPQDALQLRLEPGHEVADAAHAELPEVGEVLPHLGGVQAEALRQLLGRDGLDAVLLELLQAARINGQTTHRHLRNARNLERRASRHRSSAPGAPGRTPGTPEIQGGRYDFTKSRMTAMTKTNSVSDSMKARPRSMAVWMRAMAPGCRAMASTAEPAARPCPRPHSPAARPKPRPAASTAKALAMSPPPVASAAQARLGAASTVIMVTVRMRRTASSLWWWLELSGVRVLRQLLQCRAWRACRR